MPGITLDAGALIAIDRNDRRIAVLLARAGETRARITIPGSALAQAIRRPERQVRLARLVRQPTTDVVDLGRVDATNVGRLLAASGTADVVDAHIVVCARRAHQRVVTSDPDDLCLLDPSLDVFTSDPHDHKPAFGSAWAELAPCDEGPPVCPAPSIRHP
jgi:hypothetical protein